MQHFTKPPTISPEASGVLTCCVQVRLLLGGASKQKPAGDDTTGVALRVGEGGPGATVALGGAPALSGKLAVGRGVTAGEVAT